MTTKTLKDFEMFLSKGFYKNLPKGIKRKHTKDKIPTFVLDEISERDLWFKELGEREYRKDWKLGYTKASVLMNFHDITEENLK